MKIKSLLLMSFLAMAACAHRDEGAGDDGPTDPNPDPDPDPDPQPDPDCTTDDDCVDAVDCNAGTCLSGTCSYESTCADGEVCNVETDACEQAPHPTTHDVVCFQTGDTLYLTISGLLTDSVYGGALANPKFIWVASDHIAGSWNASATVAAPKVVLTDAERTSGYVTSASINLPSSQAQRFTLMIWSDDGGGYARRFDLGDWTVSGDGCARVKDGAPAGTTDGYVIGRAPLCANACDDGNASTLDACTSNGCTHAGSTPSNGTLSCAEAGANTNVTVGGGILANLITSGLTPDSTWKIGFGYGGSTSTQVNWVSDTSSYVLPMPNSVTEYNLVLRDGSGAIRSWFNVAKFDAGGTCGKTAANTAFTHTAPSTAVGTIQCSLVTVDGVPKRKVVISPLIGHDIREGLIGIPTPWPTPSAIQYGGSDGWQLPYPSGSQKPQLSWTNGTSPYFFYLATNVDDFNFYAVVGTGGYYFDLDKWPVSNVGSAGCQRVGGGISIN